ncbi:MAG: TetR family transcriptional regulator [Actinobacteria bacterium]|nr:TetR family transcriptional regulator [Actinomycetota bacterium]
MDTRQRIIETAEVLFAQHGYEATSLRQLTDIAGVNIAAVNYHFGSKEKLLTAVLDRVVQPITDQRLEMLDTLEAEGEPSVRQLLTAFLQPDLDAISALRSRHPDLPRFVSRMYSEGSELMGRIMGRQFADIQRRFYASFRRALPELDEEELGWRMHCIVGIVLYLFAGVAAEGMPEMVGPDTERNLQRLLDITEPIMTAEISEVSTAH